MGAFYLVNDDGSLVSLPGPGDDRDYLDDIRGLRDLINPDFNLEMVFLSSEFGDTPADLFARIASHGAPDEPYEDYDSYEEYLYNTYRNIDVITIPAKSYTKCRTK